jgi:hypothetical protein
MSFRVSSDSFPPGKPTAGHTAAMAVVVGCVVLVLAGLAAVVGWGGLAIEPPSPATPDAAGPTERPPAGLVVRWYLWYLAVAIISGVGAGLLAAGPGGRLVMRLLAVTAGAEAQGKLTEAGQIVGRITVDGSLGFIVFTALFFGPLWGAAYLLLRRWLPAGRAGGLAYGAVLLVAAATRVEPLRRANPDFDLVGPGWVSVAAFTALALLHGMLVAALAGRLSRSVPLLAARPGAIAAHAPLLLLLLIRGPVVGAFVLVIVSAVVVLATRIGPLVAAWRSRRAVTVGRVALAVAVVAALPGFVSAVVDILGHP